MLTVRPSSSSVGIGQPSPAHERFQARKRCVQHRQIIVDRAPDVGVRDPLLVLVREEVPEPRRLTPWACRINRREIFGARQILDGLADGDEVALNGSLALVVGEIGFSPCRPLSTRRSSRCDGARDTPSRRALTCCGAQKTLTRSAATRCFSFLVCSRPAREITSTERPRICSS